MVGLGAVDHIWHNEKSQTHPLIFVFKIKISAPQSTQKDKQLTTNITK